MPQRLLLLAALALCLSQPAVVRAQLTFEEYKLFNQLLTEPDAKPSFDKRLQLIGDAMEREGDPKPRPGGNIQVDLKRARIPAVDGVPFLLKRLDHAAEAVRRTALRMLGAYGVEAKSAVPAVLDRMKQDTVKALRGDAMLTLSKIEPTNAESAAAILERLGADDKDDVTNRTALHALVAMATVVPKSAVPRIVKFQEHRSTDMGALAHELVGKILALERPTLEQLKTMTAIEWRKDADQGYAAFASIADAGNKADFAVPLVLAVLDAAPPPYLESVAVDTLAKIRTGNPRAIATFLDRSTAKDLFVRNKARQALQFVELKEPASVRALAAGLRLKDQWVRLDAAMALRRWDEPGRLSPEAHAEMLSPLLETLGELDDAVSPAHLEAYLSLLRRFGTRAAPAADGLLKRYQSETYAKKLGPAGVNVRGKLLAALANVGVPESGREPVLNVLEKGVTLQADGGYAYAAAARAAATFAEPSQLVPLLVPALKVKGQERALFFIDWSGDAFPKATTVRLEALRALAKVGGPADEALPLLRQIAEDKAETPTSLDFSVQQEARRAFKTITGTSLPPAKGVFADGKKEMLHLDERLQVKLTLKLNDATPQDVFKHLQQATNLTFTLGENINPDTTVWASMHALQMPAFHCMRQLAASPTVEGTWEDVGDGYRLIGKKKPPVGDPAKTAKAPSPPVRNAVNDPLPDDPRLQKRLTIRLSDATVQDILRIIREATGVNLTVENVDTETLLYKSVTWSNTTAWLALRNIAESPRVQGTWEKDSDGYRLRGTAAAQPGAVQPNDAQADTNAGASWPRIAVYLGIGLLVTIVAGAALALAWRLRGRRRD